MHFVIHCTDRPDSADVRAANRRAHLAHLERYASSILAGGPLLGEDGASPVGSLLVMEFPDRAAAERFAADDPYAKAGLFAVVTITPWRQTYPKR
jgi:uncharacterized protein YciI